MADQQIDADASEELKLYLAGHPNALENQKKALDHFKDWSNYLLVATVAMLGWIATNSEEFEKHPAWAEAALWLLAISTVFAIFTLAHIPRVAEKLPGHSIYLVEVPTPIVPFIDRVRFIDKIPFIGPALARTRQLSLTMVCWPQHFFFLLGIGAVVKAAGF